MSRLTNALQQLEFSRRYTLRLLDHVDRSLWFRQPAEGVTHIAWQVGHLAMAQYRLLLERMRGSRPADEALIPQEFLTLFAKGSVPDPDQTLYPSIDEILQVLERVNTQAHQELPDVVDTDLDLPPHKPHPLFETRLGSLHWCAQHEMMHAGQIGLLRRLFGLPAVW